ncbi:hypothetical protein LJC31_05280 [Synergistaceae bacterium OttesenSCG-928-I11]|nr:hypothetical protein [Synergistaceae bacterium OttesenSCG-928-I11]
MKKIILVAFAAMLSLMLFTGAALADYKYRFDDVYGPSGRSGQWVIAVKSSDVTSADRAELLTRGNRAVNELWAAGNFVNSRDHVYSLNGLATLGADSDREQITPLPIDYIFMVIPETTAETNVHFGWASPGLNPGETFTCDVNIAEDDYFSVKESKGAVAGKPLPTYWYNFNLTKSGKSGEYGTAKTYMSFQQNPTSTPSQTLNIPLVIANVANGNAMKKPLEFQMVLRENATAGSLSDIVAYDRFEWNVDQNMTHVSKSDWIFVPWTDNILGEATYNLTAHIRNFCGIRYELQRYDNRTYTTMTPDKWEMDLPLDRLDIGEGLYNRLYLDHLSHIAPGMITTYSQRYNADKADEKVFRMYGVDNDRNKIRDLTLRHNMIRGTNLGERKTGGGVGTTNYSIQGFKYTPLHQNFLNDASCDLVAPSLEMPEPDDLVMTSMTVTDDQGSPVVQTAVSTIKIEAPVPSRMIYNKETHPVVGLLPLHITLNLKKSNHYVSQKWDALLDQWKRTGDIKDAFFDSFRLHMHSESGDVDVDLFEWMKKQGIYNTNVKVFMDEDKVFSDTTKGCITVSFIAMLVDSYKEPRPDSNDPSKGNAVLLKDKDDKTSLERKIMALRDCNRNDKWDTTLYIRYVNIPVPPTSQDVTGSSGGGGGCSAGLPMTIVGAAFCILPFLIRKRGR